MFKKWNNIIFGIAVCFLTQNCIAQKSNTDVIDNYEKLSIALYKNARPSIDKHYDTLIVFPEGRNTISTDTLVCNNAALFVEKDAIKDRLYEIVFERRDFFQKKYLEECKKLPNGKDVPLIITYMYTIQGRGKVFFYLDSLYKQESEYLEAENKDPFKLEINPTTYLLSFKGTYVKKKAQFYLNLEKVYFLSH